MTRQQEAREIIRNAWPKLLADVMRPAIIEAQEKGFAAVVANAVWPHLTPDQARQLDRNDPSLLLAGPSIPPQLGDELLRQLEIAALPLMASKCPINPYGRGGGLRALINDELAAKKSMLSPIIDALFADAEKDRLAAPEAVKAKVLTELSNRCLDELASLKSTDPENDAKRHLKTLTALVAPGGTRDHRDAMFSNIGDGKTAGFPYILKYLSRDVRPELRALPPAHAVTLNGFSPALESLLPEASLVRTCLERYSNRSGILEQFINIEEEPGGELADQYQNLPSFIPAVPGGILVPKANAVRENRQSRFRMPDGVVCALGMCSLLESIIRQAVNFFKLGSVVKPRAGVLIKRLRDAGRISHGLADQMEILFDQRSLAVRDAASHGAFFADDPAKLHDMITVLSALLEMLVAELEPLGVLTAPRWDCLECLDAGELHTIDQQFEPGLNMVDQLLDDSIRRHMFKVTKILVPDKRLMAWSGFLLWVSGQHDVKTAANSDPTKGYVGLMANLCVLEELFRATFEIHGRRVMVVTPDGGDRIRCELAMLDSAPGHLLEPAALSDVFGQDASAQGFQSSIAALRGIRDMAFHGAWTALPGPLAKYAHLVVKVLVTLCSTLQSADKRP